MPKNPDGSLYFRNFAERSRWVREQIERGVSIKDLAHEAKMCRSTVQRYTGLTPPSLKPTKDPRESTTDKIFKALGYVTRWHPK